MRKCLWVLLALIITGAILGCTKESNTEQQEQVNASLQTDGVGNEQHTDEQARKEYDVRTLTGLNAWYQLTLSYDYDMFLANYGDVISKEFYDKLSELYGNSGITATEACLLHTLEDGTRILVTLKLEDAHWNQFSIKSIEILD